MEKLFNDLWFNPVMYIVGFNQFMLSLVIGGSVGNHKKGSEKQEAMEQSSTFFIRWPSCFVCRPNETTRYVGLNVKK